MTFKTLFQNKTGTRLLQLKCFPNSNAIMKSTVLDEEDVDDRPNMIPS